MGKSDVQFRFFANLIPRSYTCSPAAVDLTYRCSEEEHEAEEALLAPPPRSRPTSESAVEPPAA